MSESFYIPVGTKLNGTALEKITLAQIQSREVFDPRFAGFETDFDWSRYLDVRIPPGVLLDRVAGSLDQFARTPEGQHMIRQAGAMQNYRIYGSLEPKGKPQARVPMADGLLVGTSVGDSAANQHQPSNGIIHYNLDDIQSLEYRGMDGRYYDWSVQNIVFHELSHSMDAVSTDYNKDQIYQRFAQPLLKAEKAYSDYIQKRGPDLALTDALLEFRERYGAPLTEYPAIRTTNAFMQRYYNEPARALSHAEPTTSRREKPYEMFITPETLGQDHFYDALLNAPATPQVLNTHGRTR